MSRLLWSEGWRLHLLLLHVLPARLLRAQGRRLHLLHVLLLRLNGRLARHRRQRDLRHALAGLLRHLLQRRRRVLPKDGRLTLLNELPALTCDTRLVHHAHLVAHGRQHILTAADPLLLLPRGLLLQHLLVLERDLLRLCPAGTRNRRPGIHASRLL